MSLDPETQEQVEEQVERLRGVLHDALRLANELGHYLEAPGDAEAVADAVAYLGDAMGCLDDVDGT